MCVNLFTNQHERCGSMFLRFRTVQLCLYLINLQVQSSSMCCIWWCRHWLTDERLGPWMSSTGGHPWTSGGHDGTRQDWNGPLQVYNLNNLISLTSFHVKLFAHVNSTCHAILMSDFGCRANEKIKYLNSFPVFSIELANFHALICLITKTQASCRVVCLTHLYFSPFNINHYG